MTWRTWRDRMGFGFADERIPGVPWENESSAVEPAATERIISEQRVDLATLTQRLALWMRIADRDYAGRREAEQRALAAEVGRGLMTNRVAELEGFLRELADIQENLVSVNRECAQEIDRLHDRERVLQEAAKRRRRR